MPLPCSAAWPLHRATSRTLASSFSVTAVLGPLLMSQLFAAYSDQDGVYFPGAPFFAGGLMIAAAWLSFAVAMRRLNSSP